jgi:DNA-binding transcriptional LysR family regulator
MKILLNDMALFVEVCKTMSFHQAAKAVNMPNSTLSRRISALEKEIGLRLLHRTTRKIELTEAGQLYYQRCKQIIEEAKLAHEQLGDMLAQPSGVLRASLPVDFATAFLAPLLPEFCSKYPNITFEFDLTPRKVDMVTESFDVAIRMGEQHDSNLIARRLASLPTYLYASPRYLEISGEPIKPADLKKHECFNFFKFSEWNLNNGTQTAQISTSGKFIINNVGMIRQLGVLGMGIILMPQKMVMDDVANGLLCRVLPSWHGSSISVYAITETRLIPAKTRCFIDFLSKRLDGT